MSDLSPKLLLTRPEAAARRFAAQIEDRFGPMSVVLSPAMRIIDLVPDLPAQEPDALIFTSENAVSAFCRLFPRRDLPVWCVGQATLSAARAEGFDARPGPGDAAGLVAELLATRPPGILCWPRGARVAADLAEVLILAGLETISLVCYMTETVPPSPEALAALAQTGPLILPLFSPRSAQAAIWARDRQAELWVVALSPAIAAAARDLAPERLITAAAPNTPALLDAMADFLLPGHAP